jgi:hypothetical protein
VVAVELAEAHHKEPMVETVEQDFKHPTLRFLVVQVEHLVHQVVLEILEVLLEIQVQPALLQQGYVKLFQVALVEMAEIVAMVDLVVVAELLEMADIVEIQIAIHRIVEMVALAVVEAK